MTPARAELAAATRRLAEAGVDRPRVDAESLLAHVLGIERSRLVLAPEPTADQGDRLAALVERRAGREPLQHLLGTAVLGPVEVAVGPGVFVPRPETETLLAWGLERLAAGPAGPRVLDLCAGSGALGLAVAVSRPDAEVHAVEADPAARRWLEHNLARYPGAAVHPVAADVTAPDLLAGLTGTVDLVLANPPYVPTATAVAAEVAHDPPGAVFAGADGLAVIRPLVAAAARLLRPGAALGVEHDDGHAAAVRAVLAGAGFVDVGTRPDLAGRPRVTVGRLG